MANIDAGCLGSSCRLWHQFPYSANVSQGRSLAGCLGLSVFLDLFVECCLGGCHGTCFFLKGRTSKQKKNQSYFASTSPLPHIGYPPLAWAPALLH